MSASPREQERTVLTPKGKITKQTQETAFMTMKTAIRPRKRTQPNPPQIGKTARIAARLGQFPAALRNARVAHSSFTTPHFSFAILNSPFAIPLHPLRDTLHRPAPRSNGHGHHQPDPSRVLPETQNYETNPFASHNHGETMLDQYLKTEDLELMTRNRFSKRTQKTALALQKTAIHRKKRTQTDPLPLSERGRPLAKLSLLHVALRAALFPPSAFSIPHFPFAIPSSPFAFTK